MPHQARHPFSVLPITVLHHPPEIPKDKGQVADVDLPFIIGCDTKCLIESSADAGKADQANAEQQHGAGLGNRAGSRHDTNPVTGFGHPHKQV